jgi:isopentenyl-diphosphate delta-isomerase
VALTQGIPATLDGGEPVTIVALGTDRLWLETSSVPRSGERLLATDRFPEKFSGALTESGEFVVADPSPLRDLLALVRKEQHIAICAGSDVEASDRYTGFSDVVLLPRALPERERVETATSFLGKTFAAPILITGMTGGISQAAEINRRLAKAAVAMKIPMGVGSQRLAIENSAHAPIFTLKRQFPDLFLIGNLGMGQLSVKAARAAVEMIDADALAIHINTLQELVQIEGDRTFGGVFEQIAEVASALKVPVIVKEVGVGIDTVTARRLLDCGVAALDIGGKGGTSWSLIEGKRSEHPLQQRLGETFRNFGIPTAVGLHLVSDLLKASGKKFPLIATGGIRNGLDVAKAIGLGAALAGIGLPLFRAALVDDEAPGLLLEAYVKELHVAMLCSGAGSLSDLRSRLRLTAAFHAELNTYSE